MPSSTTSPSTKIYWTAVGCNKVVTTVEKHKTVQQRQANFKMTDIRDVCFKITVGPQTLATDWARHCLQPDCFQTATNRHWG